MPNTTILKNVGNVILFSKGPGGENWRMVDSVNCFENQNDQKIIAKDAQSETGIIYCQNNSCTQFMGFHSFLK